MTDTSLLAVNGTLMRGLKLNPNLTNAGGLFVREDKTDGWRNYTDGKQT
jgi:hypothetical protein